MSENIEMNARQQWDSLFTAYHMAAQAHDAADEGADPLNYDRVCKLRHDAWDALLLAPAPDFVALGWKINELFGAEAMAGEIGDAGWGRAFTDAIAADANRLLADAPPTRFDAGQWISDWTDAEGGWVCADGRAMLCAAIPATPRQTALMTRLRNAGGSDAVLEALLTLDRRVH